MAGKWFQSYKQPVWHRSKVLNDECKKCKLPEIVGLCGVDPDFPIWTDNPDYEKRCVSCVSHQAGPTYGLEDIGEGHP